MESQKRYGWGQGQGGDHRSDEFGGDGGDAPGDRSGPKQRAGKSVDCPDCGKVVKNLGAHKRFCKANTLIIDEYMGKSLSFLLESMENLLKTYNHKTSVLLDKDNNENELLTITIRILLRR